MKIKDLFHETFTALWSNKVRTGLTILGIVIGIGSVISMVSIGQGSQSSIQARIQSIGSNLLMVQPGSQKGQGYGVSAGRGSAKSLTQDDATAIAGQVANITAVAQEASGRYQVTAKGTNTNTTIDGVNPAYLSVRNLSIDQGVFVSDQDVQNMTRVAVIGPTVLTDLFGTDAVASDAIGQTIRIKGLNFQVVGVTVSKGGNGFGSQDNMVYIPVSTALRELVGNQYLTTIDVQVNDQSNMTNAQNDITSLLLARHNISDSTQADFQIQNEADIVATASSVADTFTLLLGAVAGISLVVGGIGIMNMMLTTVTERTREIGLRKAIGAKKRDINRQFLVEATVLTVIGGIVGILLGCSVSFICSFFGIVATQISIASIVLAFCVSATIGILFGYYPARRASELNPIEALRYE
jgi:putative ABC transport system permease protein